MKIFEFLQGGEGDFLSVKLDWLWEESEEVKNFNFYIKKKFIFLPLMIKHFFNFGG